MIGTKVSHYTILEHIGVGGMGNVYKAFDPRLDRSVALKILHPSAMLDQAKRQRFIQEARIASALNHPNIITVYEIGEESEQCFIATEFVDGQTLRQKFQNNPIPVQIVLEIATQIVKALKVAHLAGIIHRDIKPENIMVRPDGYVKVLDFGLAKLLDMEITYSGARRPLIKTENNLVLGTVRYMSPEQVQHLPIDHRSDIFSFGILLYEMLTGKLPFSGQKAVDIAYEIIGANPLPLNEVATGLVSHFQFLVNRCLEKDPSTRYQDADDLLKDLRQLHRRLDILASQIDSELVPTVFSPEPLVSPGITRPSVVILYPDNLTGSPELSWYRVALAELLIARLSWNVGLDVVSHRQLADVFYQLNYELEQDIDKPMSWEIARRVGVERFLLSSFTLLNGNISFSIHSYEVSTGQLNFSLITKSYKDEVFTLVDQIALRIERELQINRDDIEPPKVIDLVTNSLAALQNFESGFNSYQKGDLDKARENFLEAVKEDNRFALAYYHLSRIEYWQNNPEHLLHLDNALEHCGRVSESERLIILLEKASLQKDYINQQRLAEELVAQYPREKMGYLFLGQSHHWRGDCDRAFIIFQQALSFDIRLLFEGAEVGLGISQVAESYLDTANFDRLEQLARNQSKHSWLSDHLLGVIFYYKHNYSYAEAAFNQAARNTGSVIPKIWDARVQMLTGRPDLAEQYLQLLSSETTGLEQAFCLRDLAETFRIRGRLRDWLNFLLEHERELSPLADLDPTMSPCFWQGYFFEQIGDVKQALAQYEMASEEINKDNNSLVETVNNVWVKVNYGRLLALAGNYEKAIEILEQVKLIGRNMPNQKIERLALFLWGTVEFYQGNYELSIELLEKSIWSYTNGFDLAICIVAQCLRQLKGYQRAIELLDSLQSYTTLHSASYFCSSLQIDLERAKIYEAKKDYQQAIKHYSRCLEYWQNADQDFLGRMEAETGLELLSP
ncbi:MAG: protein kinase [Acidobacteria bacterium]|nr:protein kinase [Acidobacteriota bacterium]